MRDDVTSSTGGIIAPRVRWAAWFGALAVYTYLLVVPNDWLPPWLRTTVSHKITDEFTYGKLAHAASYALLTAATFALPVGRVGWWACVALLSLHGFGTEYVQTFTGRHGCWLDVLIDHVGIAAGLLLGGLGYRRWNGRPGGGGPKRVSAAPQVQHHARGEDRDADPL
jgi:hypothetical protein